jgi:drug/metabolite transporter (DMT)-like permease
MRIKRRYWFPVILFIVGLVLFSLGQYYTFRGEESDLGFELSLSGLVLWAVLLAIGMIYVARVRLKILRDASRF